MLNFLVTNLKSSLAFDFDLFTRIFDLCIFGFCENYEKYAYPQDSSVYMYIRLLYFESLILFAHEIRVLCLCLIVM